MNIDANALKARGATIYRDFTAGQRVTLVVAALAVVVGGYMFMQWAAAPSWTPLYTSLEGDDAADVTAELNSMGIAYELEDGGTTIMVDRSDVYQTRIDLSAQGLPRVGGDGWNLLDEQGLTTSEFRQRVDFQRAMEGELAKTIASMETVDVATVHLVMPEDDLFSGDDVHPSASVLLETEADAVLSSGQIQAVVHMISSSVEGMKPDYVTVADSTGRVLNAPGQDGVDIAAGEQRVAQQAGYEQAVARSIESLLLPVTGVGKAHVVVSADLDFDQKESVTETFGEPDTAPVVSESTSSEEYTGGAGNQVAGVLGPDGAPVADGDGSDYNKEDASRTFAVNKVTEQIKAAPGSVQRLSVAVLVDENAGVNTADIQNLVSAAAGIVPERGDTIEVSAMAFGAADVADTADAGTSSSGETDDMVMTLARTGGVLLLVLIVLLLAYRSAKKSSISKYPTAIPLPNAAEETAALLADLAGEIDGGFGGDVASRAGAKAMELPTADAPRHVVLQEQIGDLIDRQPEDVAAVLRTWLADRRT